MRDSLTSPTGRWCQVTDETVWATVARNYAESGWKVFPVRPGGKLPLIPAAHPEGDPLKATCRGECGRHGHGVHDATTDPDTVIGWWRRCPNANIGVAAGGNRLAILDVDVTKGGAESLAKLTAYLTQRGTPLPETLTQYTGTGGYHFVYSAPEGGIKNVSNAFGPDMPGLDTRGRGGYIVAAPSIHPNGNEYRWRDLFADTAPWPTILTRLMDPPRPAPPVRNYRRPAISDRYAATALDNEVTAVRDTREGGRNSRLNTAAMSLGQLVAAGALDEGVVRNELYQAAISAGLTPNETTRTILSGLRAGMAKPRSNTR